jgi:hypothetical protein
MALKNVMPPSKLSTFEGQLSRNEPIAADKNVNKLGAGFSLHEYK